MAAQGSSFISCTALDKSLGVRPPVTLIAEFPWMVAPGACLGKRFLVIDFIVSRKTNLHNLLSKFFPHSGVTLPKLKANHVEFV